MLSVLGALGAVVGLVGGLFGLAYGLAKVAEDAHS